MSERLELVHRVVDELREMKEAPPFEPTPDIDMVWVLSAPGTYKEPSQSGVYKGISADRQIIDYGIGLIQKITALRLGKEVSIVTKEDIEAAGPTLYYNGEDSYTPGAEYSQNQHLQEVAEDPNFLMPASKIIFGHIDQANTPAQIRDFIEYLQRSNMNGKIAVVSLIQHSVRVSRYLHHYRDLLPDKVTLLNVPRPEVHRAAGKVLREVRKVADYVQKGDLSEDPYF